MEVDSLICNYVTLRAETACDLNTRDLLPHLLDRHMIIIIARLLKSVFWLLINKSFIDRDRVFVLCNTTEYKSVL